MTAEVLRGTRRLVVLEDCLARGCVGERVAALLAETGEEPERLVLKNAGESLPPQGTVPQLEHALGLDADGVAGMRSRRCCMGNKTETRRAPCGARLRADAPEGAGDHHGRAASLSTGQRVDKPGTAVANEAELEVRGHTLRYVSRGGLKLEKAMQTFPITLEGKTCADIGASTGGFTDCMLQNGARQRLRRRRRLWPARLEAPQRRARRLSGADERALSDARSRSRSRWTSRRSTCRSSR